MKSRLFCKIMMFWAASSCVLAQGDFGERQIPPGRNFRGEIPIPYKVLPLITQNPDTLDVFLYIQIQNRYLQFITKGDSLFEATYETTILIRNTDKEILQNQIRRGKINAFSYLDVERANSSQVESFHFRLRPGKYDLYLEIFDMETRRQFTRQEELNIPDLGKETFSLTPLFFVKTGNDITNPQRLTPVFEAGRLQNDTSLVALFFINSDGTLHTLNLRQYIVDAKSDTLWKEETPVPMNGRIQPVLLHLKQHLPFGKYDLDVYVSDGTHEKNIRENFYVKWGSHPAFMPELDLAVQSLIYVADESELSNIQKQTPNDQSKWLEDFWKTRDPDPETEYNGLEDEYYRRVAMANQRFSTPDGALMGWKSDRGRIYIVYGPPSDVENPRMEYGESSRYEIWYYRNLQRRFIFLDRFGNGDYRLISQE